MMLVRTGSCLCGSVTFRVEGDFDGFFLCHCSRCRKGTGSAHAANLISAAAELTWLSGRENVTSYKVEGTRHARSFCGRCGGPVPDVQGDGAWITVPAGSLDGDVGLRPDAHICLASRADWDEGLERVPGKGGLPG